MDHTFFSSDTETLYSKKSTLNRKYLSSTYSKSSDKTSRQLNHLFSNSIWREICHFSAISLRLAHPLTIQLIILISKSQSGRESLVVREECMFHVPLCGCQLSMEGKRRESMHDKLKIASVGSAIFSKSGNGGYMWFLKLA